MLNDKDLLQVKTNPTAKQKLQILLNGSSIFDANLNTDSPISLSIQFDKDQNTFKLVYNDDKASAIVIPNLINPELRIDDISVNDQYIEDLNNIPQTCYIKLQRLGKYVFINNLNNPYACKKTIKLFASSPIPRIFPSKRI